MPQVQTSQVDRKEAAGAVLMVSYVNITRFGTLVIGSLLSLTFLGPLGLVVFLLIWLDTVFLMNYSEVKIIGLDLITLAAVISGIVMGPIFGFLFSMIVLPLLIVGLYLLTYRFLLPGYPNIDFLSLGLAAGLAGIMAPIFPLYVTALAAVMFRFIISILIERRFRGTANYPYAFVNTLVSFFFIFVLNAAGILMAGA